MSLKIEKTHLNFVRNPSKDDDDDDDGVDDNNDYEKVLCALLVFDIYIKANCVIKTKQILSHPHRGF